MLQHVKVLIVDDQPNQLGALQGALQKERCALRVATSGKAGREEARTFQPHVVLLDVQMPSIDGFATCHHFAADPDLAHIPIIFLTVANTSEERLKGFASGAVDYIEKPATPPKSSPAFASANFG